MTTREHVSLSSLTTFRIGGLARYVIDCESEDDIRAALAFAKEKGLPFTVLGGGSNVLAPDEGYDGVVIRPHIEGIAVEGTMLVAGAGVSWDTLVSDAVSRGLWGLENLSGIPGTVGGAVVQNVGAYGAAVSETLLYVDAFDVETSGIRRLSLDECEFGYRASIFKKLPGRFIITRVAFGLTTEPLPNLSYRDPNRAYKDMARILAENPEPSLEDIRRAVLSIRADKFPDLAKEGTAGSFFENPILRAEAASALKETYPDMPLFSMPETKDQKVPLGWILDHALHLKGHAVGAARLFERQAMVIAAGEGATAAHVNSLADDVAARVHDATGIAIKREVRSMK